MVPVPSVWALRGDAVAEERRTDELMDQLLASASPDAYLAQNKLPNRSLSDYLRQLLKEKGRYMIATASAVALGFVI